MATADYMYLRALSESSNNDDVLDILSKAVGKSTVDSTVLIIKAGWVFGKQIGSASLTRDPNAKLEKFQKCLRDAKALRKAANKIPPDGVGDHIWRLITKPWWSSAYAYSKATDKGALNTMAKDSAISKFDMIIKVLEHDIEELKEDVKKEGGDQP